MPYSFPTVGQKIEWMRANPLVCVGADEVVSPQQWASVIVFGRYEELPDTPEYESARTFSYKGLRQHALWWKPAYAKTILHGTQRPQVSSSTAFTSFKLLATVPRLSRSGFLTVEAVIQRSAIHVTT